MARALLAASARGSMWAALAALAMAGCRDLPVDPFSRLAGGGGGGGAGGALTDAGGGMDGGAGAGGTGNVTCPTSLVGFATVGATTIGGGSAAPVTVTTLADLMAAAGQTVPAVIVVSGLITVPPEMQTSTGFQVPVESNKTILGADSQSGLTGGGLLILRKTNVIIRNLSISLAIHTDAITIQNAQHVWVDHCALSSDRDHSSGYYDGLIDITHASDFVTVSWTHFFNHFNTSLVGHSDANAAEDTGHLTVSYHHNLFENTNAGMPRVRFGSVHVFNNHFVNVDDYAIASQMNAEVLVERNSFEKVSVPITNQHEISATSFPGQVVESGNLYDADSANSNLIGPVDAGTFDFTPPYAYPIESAETAASLVGSCVGPR